MFCLKEIFFVFATLHTVRNGFALDISLNFRPDEIYLHCLHAKWLIGLTYLRCNCLLEVFAITFSVKEITNNEWTWEKRKCRIFSLMVVAYVNVFVTILFSIFFDGITTNLANCLETRNNGSKGRWEGRTNDQL